MINGLCLWIGANPRLQFTQLTWWHEKYTQALRRGKEGRVCVRMTRATMKRNTNNNEFCVYFFYCCMYWISVSYNYDIICFVLASLKRNAVNSSIFSFGLSLEQTSSKKTCVSIQKSQTEALHFPLSSTGSLKKHLSTLPKILKNPLACQGRFVAHCYLYLTSV